jgi:hypothetical protein
MGSWYVRVMLRVFICSCDVNNIEGLEEETADDATGSDAPVTQKQMQQLHQMLAAMHSQHRGNGGSNSSGSKDARTPRSLPVIKGLTPQQLKAHMDAGKCFGCGSTSHLIRGCPTDARTRSRSRAAAAASSPTTGPPASRLVRPSAARAASFAFGECSAARARRRRLERTRFVDSSLQ